MIKNYLDYLKEYYRLLKEQENVRDRIDKPKDKSKVYKKLLVNKKEK